jgi:mitogen-activated protein kinase kinase
MALTVLEVALNRFPFPGPGEATLNGPIELLTYLTTMDPPAVPDEVSPISFPCDDSGLMRVSEQPEHNIKYSNAFRNFIQLWSVLSLPLLLISLTALPCSLDKNPSTRPFPKKLLSHPWIKRSIDRDPPADLAGWVRSTWESV